MPPADARPRWQELLLHEDDEIVLLHLVRTPAVDRIVVTFDPLAVDTRQPAFATGLLDQLPLDRLTVRRKRENFYQPLSREAFATLAGPTLAPYKRRFAYGSSLGAYAALYFTPGLVDRILAISPRITCHPAFGSARRQREVPFEHARFDARRPLADRPLVYYDPLDPFDGPFVREELQPAFPRGDWQALRFSGHPTTTFLADVGHLTPLVRALLTDTPPPPLDRGRRKRSAVWVRALSVQCTQRGKPRWGRALALHSLTLTEHNPTALRALIRAELALDRLDEAEALIVRCAAEYPAQVRHLEGLRHELARRRAPPPNAWQRLRARLGRWKRRLLGKR